VSENKETGIKRFRLMPVSILMLLCLPMLKENSYIGCAKLLLQPLQKIYKIAQTWRQDGMKDH
jgi:hypothetical protein